METYEEFAELIKDKVAQRLGEDYQVRVVKILKNNGITETQMSIRQQGESAGPCLYLKDFYRTYKQDGNLEDAAEAVLEQFHADFFHDDVIKNLSGSLENYSKIKDRILFKLVNTACNQELLEQIPSLPYLDLSIVFYLYLNGNQNGMMSALIYNDHMEYWNVTVTDLYEAARKNTPHYLPETLMDIEQAIMGSAQEIGIEDDVCSMLEADAPAMYILSNTSGVNGAASILYPDVLRMCSQKLKGDFYILPSSIHETIQIPCMEECNPEYLGGMIQGVNDTEVSDAEILGDHAYRYVSQEDRVTAA